MLGDVDSAAAEVVDTAVNVGGAASGADDVPDADAGADAADCAGLACVLMAIRSGARQAKARVGVGERGGGGGASGC